ncbi:MAG: hypothetical protein BJ554DRAFT_405, partial [Olpidium bornovanus]
MDGIGTTRLWSFVPAVDFCEDLFALPGAGAAAATRVPTAAAGGGDGDGCAAARDDGAAAAAVAERDLEKLQVRDPGEAPSPPAASSDDPAICGRSARSGCGRDGVLNVLLVGAADTCHVLRTMSRCWRRKQAVREINFYLIENQAPVVARHMMLLSSLMNDRGEVGTEGRCLCSDSNEERAQRYLEIYSNCFLREKTYDFVKTRAAGLIRVLTGADAENPIATLFDLSALRHRERDDLEFVFNFWRDESKRFDMEDLRNRRLLTFYGIRYDSRHNVADYDYHMKLQEKVEYPRGVTIIHKREFVKWRLTGIAHEVREANYVKPNRTMATVQGLKEAGITTPKWGFFSDVSVGPFYAFGIDTEDKELLKKGQERHLHFSQEVAEFNVCSYIHEMETASPFKREPSKAIVELKAETSEITLPAAITRIHVLPFDASVTFEKRRRRYEGM